MIRRVSRTDFCTPYCMPRYPRLVRCVWQPAMSGNRSLGNRVEAPEVPRNGKPAGSNVTWGSGLGVRPFFTILLPIYGMVYATAVKWWPQVAEKLAITIGVSMLGFWGTFLLIPSFARKLEAKNICGIDLNKPGNSKTDKPIPESLGLVVGAICIICGIICQLLFSDDPNKLLQYNSGLLAVSLMSFLGFVDDVFDLRWRYKMILPLAAALPLVISYKGSTSVLVPPLLRHYLNLNFGLLDLGWGFSVYMTLLTVFCANSINIYAGLNGLEVGQSLIIAGSLILHKLLEISSGNAQEQWVQDQNLFSLIFLLLFFSGSVALLCYNWYPASVFVGDSYTYFAGTYFAVVGIHGHLSKTLLFFLVPQIINFVLSIPQLLKIVPCPRHRVPRFNRASQRMHPSSNLTLLNLILVVCGPLTEKALCVTALTVQLVLCAATLWVYHYNALNAWISSGLKL